MNPIDRRTRFGKIIRVDNDFDRELKEIVKRRIVNGKENTSRLNGDRRITKAINRHPLFKQIKEDIILSDLEDDRLR